MPSYNISAWLRPTWLARQLAARMPMTDASRVRPGKLPRVHSWITGQCAQRYAAPVYHPRPMQSKQWMSRRPGTPFLPFPLEGMCARLQCHRKGVQARRPTAVSNL